MRKVKKWKLTGIIVCVIAMVLTSCQEKATDYSQKSNWLSQPEITKDVDAFYIYSTSYFESSFEKGASDYASLDNAEMREGAQQEYVDQATVFEESCNVFTPWYRQFGMRYASEVMAKTGSLDEAIAGVLYSDITAALDYYFEHCNQGRPFIIAGHSQGSAIVRYVLKHYFKEHPDYYKRMVAAYAIGYSITKDDLKDYPHLKFATGETDTGVIISWNTESPANEGQKNGVVLPGAISINPINWKRDETYAPAEENLGGYYYNEEKKQMEKVPHVADAQVNLKRGTVITTVKNVPPVTGTDFFGPGSYHEDDYELYFFNLKANVAARVAAYKKNTK